MVTPAKEEIELAWKEQMETFKMPSGKSYVLGEQVSVEARPAEDPLLHTPIAPQRCPHTIHYFIK